MLSPEFIELLNSKAERLDEVVIYCDEIFHYIDGEEITTNDSSHPLADCDEDDFNFYKAEELEMEDDILEFIKDWKKVKKSIDNFNMNKKMTLFLFCEEFVTSEDSFNDSLKRLGKEMPFCRL